MIGAPDHVVDIELFDHQADALEAFQDAEGFDGGAYIVAMVTPLGGGKTQFGAWWSIDRATAYPASLALGVGNGYPQIDDLMVPALCKALEARKLNYELQKVRRNIAFWTGRGMAEIRLRSGNPEHVDKIARGPEYGTAWFDEGRDLDSYSFDVIAGRLRCRQVPTPFGLITTTPAGHNWLWERFVEDPPEGNHLVHNPGFRNPIIGEGYYRGLEARYTSAFWQQEGGGLFVDLSGDTAYSHYSDANLGTPEYEAHHPLCITFDNNVSPYKPAVAFQEVGNQTRVLQTFFQTDGRMWPLTDQVCDAYDHAPPPEVVLLGDPAGQNKTSDGRTDFVLARQAIGQRWPQCRIREEVFKAQQPQRARINAVNVRLWNPASDTRHVVIHKERCRHRNVETPKGKQSIGLIPDLQKVVIGSDNGIDKRSDRYTTHFAEAFGHAVHRLHGISGFKSEGRYGMGERGSRRKGRRR